jgi:hypothetical protein
MFVAYVEQCLVPTLKRNNIVVMDNIRAHKSPASARRSKPRKQLSVICLNIHPT